MDKDCSPNRKSHLTRGRGHRGNERGTLNSFYRDSPQKDQCGSGHISDLRKQTGQTRLSPIYANRHVGCALPFFHLPLTLGACCASQYSQSVLLLEALVHFSEKVAMTTILSQRPTELHLVLTPNPFLINPFAPPM
jgi:hypothetical protein